MPFHAVIYRAPDFVRLAIMSIIHLQPDSYVTAASTDSSTD